MSAVAANRAVFVLALAGLFLSLYLTIHHRRMQDVPCSMANGGCEAVDQDASSDGLGIPALRAIPTAAFGAVMYLVLVGLSVWRAATPEEPTRLASAAQWAVAAIALGVSAYLTYVEKYVIHAWCQWCLVSAAIVLLLFIFTTAEHVRRPSRVQGEAA